MVPGVRSPRCAHISKNLQTSWGLAGGAPPLWGCAASVGPKLGEIFFESMGGGGGAGAPPGGPPLPGGGGGGGGGGSAEGGGCFGGGGGGCLVYMYISISL